MRQANRQMADPEAHQTILQAIDSADAPITASALGKRPGIGTSARVKLLLAGDIASGRVFNWGKTAYWNLDPETVARQRVLAAAGRECLRLSDLKKSVSGETPKLTATAVQSAIRKLISEDRLLPKEAKTSNVSGIIDLQHPEPYLHRKITAILKSVGIERSANRIAALLAPEIEASAAASDEPSPDVQDVAEKIFAAMNRAAFAAGTTVTFHVLRQRPELAHIPKKIFDEAALLLQQDRRALLNPHGYAGSISIQEKEQLVTDGFGNYYVSIYAR
jgi:hypothetical protein